MLSVCQEGAEKWSLLSRAAGPAPGKELSGGGWAVGWGRLMAGGASAPLGDPSPEGRRRPRGTGGGEGELQIEPRLCPGYKLQLIKPDNTCLVLLRKRQEREKAAP